MKQLRPPLRRLTALLPLFALLLTGCAGQEQVGEVSQIVKTEEIVIGLLLIAALVAMLTQRLRIPYTVGLVLVGFGLTLFGQIPFLFITPDIILALLVPPLVFEAAFHLNYRDLRQNLPVILSLAVPGVILTTALVGLFVFYSAGISLPAALLFGALVAATDPVSVVALFRSMGAPRRLQVIIEGESLLNDGTAIVVFNLMLLFVLTGQFNLLQGVGEFFFIAGGGLLVGLVSGILISQLIGRIDNYLVETALTTVLAYGAYLTAEYLIGVSGVLAVVAAGLSAGQFGPRGMSPTTRIVVANFWEFAAFLANSFVFLIIGLEIDLSVLVANAPAIGWAILAVLIARAVTVYGLSWVGKGIPLAWKNVLFWGGLRGAISLALALSLTADIPNRTQLQAMAFGVVLFTLLVQSLSMKPFMKRSGLVSQDPARLEYETQHARGIALRAALNRLEKLNRDGLISDHNWDQVKEHLKHEIHKSAERMRDVLEVDPELREEALQDALREGLRVQRSTLTELYHSNIINEEIYYELVSAVDFKLISGNLQNGKDEEKKAG